LSAMASPFFSSLSNTGESSALPTLFSQRS